jgi:hypothetical protein
MNFDLPQLAGAHGRNAPRRPIGELSPIDAALLLVNGGYRLYDAQQRLGRIRLEQHTLAAEQGNVKIRFTPQNIRPAPLNEGERRNWRFEVAVDRKAFLLWSEWGPAPNASGGSGKTPYQTTWHTNSPTVTAEQFFANPDAHRALLSIYREFVGTIRQGGLGLPGAEYPED